MLRSTKFLQSPKFLRPPPPPPQVHNVPNLLISPVTGKLRYSRRDFTIGSKSLLLLLGSQTLDPFLPPKTQAEKITAEDNNTTKEAKAPSNCITRKPTKQAFLDISIDGQPAGKIIIGLYGDDSPQGVIRFSNLVSGALGITYRRKEFVKITPSYVQHGGVRSYGVDAELAKGSGSNLGADNLIEEWEKVKGKCPEVKNLAGTVSIIVRDQLKPPPKNKLVARKGKLEIDQEEVGVSPNGTEFVISVKDSPELDSSALVIGRVLEGMEVVERIRQVKTVQENTSSPYFRVAKLIGDKRAIVAERGFNRPYSKVIVTNCGLLD